MDIRNQLFKYSSFFRNTIKGSFLNDRKTKDGVVLEVVPGEERKMEVDLEDALDVAGAGRYQWLHNSLMLFALTAALVEMVGIGFVIPAAACDLDLPDSLRGVIASIPNIGIILTAPFWGQAADFYGRKPIMLISSAAAGLLGVVSAFMPGLISFAICKLATSMFLSCPSSLAYAYACEMTPRRGRDKAVLYLNFLLMVLSTIMPVLAWAILSTEWEHQTALLVLRPWRLLTILYALPLIITAVWLVAAEESPKFLMTKGRDQDALDVLRKIYAVNSRKPSDSFTVKSLKQNSGESVSTTEVLGSESTVASRERKVSALALLRPPYLKWIALTGFLMFGLFSMLNGLFILAPDTLNKVFSGSTNATGNICTLIEQPEANVTLTTTCVDTISHSTFRILSITTLAYSLVVSAASVAPLSKKTLLVSMYSVVGIAGLTAGIATNRVVQGVAMSALQVSALGIGPITAYVVDIFPTSLRGTAVGGVMMLGRAGSASGATVAGYFLNSQLTCTPTFYGFAMFTFLCAALSFLLPNEKRPVSSSETIDIDSRR